MLLYDRVAENYEGLTNQISFLSYTISWEGTRESIQLFNSATKLLLQYKVIPGASSLQMLLPSVFHD